MSRTGFYAGSFDPLTLGHEDIIQRSFSIVDRLIVGIGISASKKPVFSFEERERMIKASVGDIGHVEVVQFSGLLVNAAKQAGATTIIRGLRSAQDYEYEAQMTAMNYVMASDVETVFLSASPKTSFISSTLVRQIAEMGGDYSGFVSDNVMRELKSKFAK